LLEVRSAEPPVPPRQLRPEVPADLEAICLKCLAKEPAGRYPSAEGLADDLGRFLAGEPVLARPVGAARRAVKWVKRRPVLAGMLAALVLTTVGSLAAAVWAVRAQRVADTQKATAESALAESKADLQGLLELATRMWEVIQKDQALLAGAPGTERTRQQVLENTLAIYQRLLERRTGDPELRTMVGRLYVLVGNVLQQLGRAAEAEHSFRQAILLWEELRQEATDNPLYCNNLARSHNNLAQLIYKGRPGEANEHSGQALDLMRGLVRDYPERSDYGHHLATTHFQRGVFRHQEGKRLSRAAARSPGPAQKARARQVLGQAWDELDAARARLEGLAAAAQAPPPYRLSLAQAFVGLAALEEDRGRPHREAPDELYRKALRVYQELPPDVGKAPEARQRQAHAHYRLAGHLRRAPVQAKGGLRARQDALRHSGTALGLQQRLVDDYPLVPRYRAELAHTHLLHASLLSMHVRFKEADKSCQRARELIQELMKKFPNQADLAEHHSSLASSLHLSVVLARKQSPSLPRREAAKRRRDRIAEAIEHQERARKLAPEEPAYRELLGKARWELAHTLLELNDYAGAAEEAKRLAGLFPERSPELRSAGHLLARCAEAAKKAGEVARARQYAREAGELLGTPQGGGPSPAKRQGRAN
jgi:tetratricopeptide (TPR) repeat protein